MRTKKLPKTTTSNAVISLLLTLLFSPVITRAQSPALEKNAVQIVEKLFPGTETTTVNRYLGFEKQVKLLSPVMLRGKKGFIPIEEIRSIAVNDSLVNISFMIYLAASRKPVEEMLKTRRLEVPQEILLQSIFWNINKNEFIGKPEGFPLEGTQWTCYGDICDIVKLISIDRVEKLQNICSLTYTSGLENRFIKFLFVENSVIYQSMPLPVGTVTDRGDDSETEISYNDFKLEGHVLQATSVVRKNKQTESGNITIELSGPE
ncbi:MAG: hypothetical protein ACLFVQ_07790 [Chitinispirillaceae bacterium]